MKNRRPLKSVMLWANGMVMVFDRQGKQVRQLQGRAEEVWPRILKRADEGTTFETGVWRSFLRPMTAGEILNPRHEKSTFSQQEEK